MSNGRDHALGASLGIGLAIAFDEQRRGVSTPAPLVGGVIASLLGSLPDLIEPATSPHHRQFFHSITFAGMLVAALKQVHSWQPHSEDAVGQILRPLVMIGGGSYLIHLLMDSTTPKSIPLLGKI
ncbi:MAG: metal-dependent hydrolase [Agitococcus sp.]|nr:metal-dependent hydrolase [Agitococcus sp.]